MVLCVDEKTQVQALDRTAPILPLIPGVSDDAGEAIGGIHELLVFVTLALLVLHVAAAFKHQIERQRAAGRMPPFRAPGEDPHPSP